MQGGSARFIIETKRIIRRIHGRTLAFKYNRSVRLGSGDIMATEQGDLLKQWNYPISE